MNEKVSAANVSGEIPEFQSVLNNIFDSLKIMDEGNDIIFDKLLKITKADNPKLNDEPKKQPSDDIISLLKAIDNIIITQNEKIYNNKKILERLVG